MLRLAGTSTVGGVNAIFGIFAEELDKLQEGGQFFVPASDFGLRGLAGFVLHHKPLASEILLEKLDTTRVLHLTDKILKTLRKTGLEFDNDRGLNPQMLKNVVFVHARTEAAIREKLRGCGLYPPNL